MHNKNTLRFIFITLLFSIIMCFRAAPAYAWIHASPSSALMGGHTPLTITLTNSPGTLYVRFRATSTKNTGGIWFGGHTQVEQAGGIWYLHARIIDTGEYVVFGPYRRDFNAPNNPTIHAPSGYISTNASITMSDNGDIGSYGTDPDGGASYYKAGVKQVEYYIDVGSAHKYVGAVSITTEGVHYFHGRVQDNLGNYSAWTTNTFVIDKTNPVAASGYVSGANYISGNSYWVKPGSTPVFWMQSYDSARTDRVYMAAYRYRDSYEIYHGYKYDNTEWDGPNTSSYANLLNVSHVSSNNTTYLKLQFPLKIETIAGDDDYLIKRLAYDRAGNHDGWESTGMTVKVDGTNPTASFSTSSNSSHVKSQYVSYSMADSRSGFKYYKVRYETNGSWSGWSGANYSSTGNSTLTGEGTRRIQLYVVDNVGNTYYKTSGYYYIDRTAPVSSSGYVSGADYINGNDYWVKPGSTPIFWSQSYDSTETDITYMYAHRASDNYSFYHGYETDNTQWDSGSSSIADWTNSASAMINNRTTLKVKFPFKIASSSSDQDYSLSRLAYDEARNQDGWDSTGMKVRVDGTAPGGNNARITHITDTGYDVYIDNVTDSRSGVQTVKFPTWTDAGGQNDIRWETGTYQGGNQWKVHINKSNYGNSMGPYTTHVYSYDNVGNSSCRGTLGGSLFPINTIPIASFTVTPNPQFETGTLKYVDSSTSGDSWDSVKTKIWAYSSNNGSTWSAESGTAPTRFANSGTYQIRLTVTDTGNAFSGSKSDTDIKTVVIVRPKALFIASPKPQLSGYTITYNDTSLTNISGNAISAREWSYSSNNGVTWSTATATAPTNLITLTTTNYKIRERVKSTATSVYPSIWSDYYIDSLDILEVLTLTNFKITNMVNPPTPYAFPISSNLMPANIKTGYNNTFSVDVLGTAINISVAISDTNGNNLGTVYMSKIKDIDSRNSVWGFSYATLLDTPVNTIINFKIIGQSDSTLFDYNTTTPWNGDILKVTGSALDDTSVNRIY